MKITIERILLLIIIGLLLYNWFTRDNTGEQLLMNQNKVLEQQIDSVKQKITLLNHQLESVKKDTVTIIKSYFREVHTADSLIQVDSSNANKIIRYELNDREDSLDRYSTEPLNNWELARLGYKLIDYRKTKTMLENYIQREKIYEMDIIELDQVITLQDKQIENLKAMVEEVKPAWYNNFATGAAVALSVALGIILITN